MCCVPSVLQGSQEQHTIGNGASTPASYGGACVAPAATQKVCCAFPAAGCTGGFLTCLFEISAYLVFRQTSHTSPLRQRDPQHRAVTSSSSSTMRRLLSSCLLALLAQSSVQAGEVPHAGESSQVSYSSLQEAHQEQAEQEEHLTTPYATPVAGTLLNRITGGANPNNRRRKHSPRGAGAGHQQPGGGGEGTADAIEISGAELAVDSRGGGRPMRQQQHLDGIYLREWDVNGAPHFKRRSKVCLLWRRAEKRVKSSDGFWMCVCSRRGSNLI